MKSICKNTFNCPVEATIQLIGGKYKAVILWHLMNQTLRYSEIHKRIPNATDDLYICIMIHPYDTVHPSEWEW